MKAFYVFVTPKGRLLDPTESLESAGLQDNDHLTAIVQQVAVAATDRAFALWRHGQIVTWGDAQEGGDSEAVQAQLKRVTQVQATKRAFAALLENGDVVSWGHPHQGGDSSAVQSQLKNVQQLQATDGAFAAILADGKVISWGHPSYGGDSTKEQHLLRNVQRVFAGQSSF